MKRYLLCREDEVYSGGKVLQVFGQFERLQDAVAELNKREAQNPHFGFMLVEVLK